MQYGNTNWPCVQQCSTPDYRNIPHPGPYPQWVPEEQLDFSPSRSWSRDQGTQSLNYNNSNLSWRLGPFTRSFPDNDLELFAEHFKQRRMKLGVTQADVGRGLGAMMIPGVEGLSQSTICRFESLTLSRTNMLALRPLLQIWLDRAEALGHSGGSPRALDAPPFQPPNLSTPHQGRRKRTCITDSERRALETYFAVQPQPSGERVAQISSLLGLPKSVVRVWFCNQRQKQKRLKFGVETAKSKYGSDN
ncbi:unnamed protein product [Mesocestoides corti]|uniref:POU domain protein n=1 Tax=Mesocestoides corti TaxID=53468 RepID=A0A0R3U236_MESCO|nr:unnamed protein product [Mesocestoides corti]